MCVCVVMLFIEGLAMFFTDISPILSQFAVCFSIRLMNSNEHFSHIIFHKHLTFECLTNTPSNMTAKSWGNKNNKQQQHHGKCQRHTASLSLHVHARTEQLVCLFPIILLLSLAILNFIFIKSHN